jgi:hypothetical protein
MVFYARFVLDLIMRGTQIFISTDHLLLSEAIYRPGVCALSRDGAWGRFGSRCFASKDTSWTLGNMYIAVA